MELKHEGIYVCECEIWEETPVFYPIAELTQCKDCRHYEDGDCTNTFWGMRERDYCSEGRRKEE